MASINPYLSFDNNCREAMTFYKDCLGGELVLQTVGEMPEMAAQMPPEMKDQILHSTLTSGAIVLFGSDCNQEPPSNGNTVQLCVNCDSREEQDRFFTALASDGRITEPITDMPWGGRLGALIDKFGKYWMFQYQA